MADGNYLNERREAEQLNSIEQNRSWLTYMAAGLGTIALGGLLLKSRIATGNTPLSNLFNFLGLPRGIKLSDVAANTGAAAARSNTTGIRSILNATFDVKKNSLVLGPIDIVGDLRNSIEAIGINTSNKEIADHIAEKTTEYINRRFAGGGNNVGYFTRDLERVTIQQVMDDQVTWRKILGTEQVDILENAVGRGLLSKSHVLDQKIFFNRNTREVLDFRLRNLSSKLVEGEGGTLTRSFRFDMFGQGKVVDSLIGGAGERSIAVIGPGEGYRGSRMFIDGRTYGYIKGADGKYAPTLLSEGRKLRRTGDPLELITASREGRLDINLPTRSGIKTPLGWMEENLGIGPAYATRFNPIERWIINPIKRARALATGRGVVVRNPFAPISGGNKGFDAVFGADLPELVAGRGVKPVAGGGATVPFSSLGPIQRLGVIFDLLSNYSVVKSSSQTAFRRNIRKALVGSDLVVPPKLGSVVVRGKTIPSNSAVNTLTDISKDELTATGHRSITSRYNYYDVPASRAADIKDFSVYMLHRLNSLFSESFLGIAMRPDHRLSVNIARAAMIPVVYEAGKQAVSYADYVTESLTGISPIKTVASIYAGARLAQQKIRELIGIQPAAKFLDTYFPGSVNSEGSFLARSLVAPLAVASMFLRTGRFTQAALGAAVTYAAIGGPDPGQTASDLYDEYSGEKKVPVRKGRLWGLGYTPFFGGKPDRYESSWYAKLTSDYRDNSIYGSETEYWRYHANVFGIPFPTPSNLFGLLNILNPYRLEKQHLEDRPYPVTSSPLNSFPIIGPILGATVGQLFKPNRYTAPTTLPLVEAGLAERGLTPSHARMLGIPAMNATSQEAEDPATALNILARQANIATEPVGIYKFVMEFFGVKLSPGVGTQYADSNMMQDPGRALYDMNIGGMFGQTEMIRRFLVNDYSSAYRRSAAVNTIRNNMPRWLPGAFSENKSDQGYFLDFTQGDPYVKIEDGEARLPGAGYESLNKLHSGRAGVYDDVDRFLILSDVAPYSSAYRTYEQRVMSMELDDTWRAKVDRAIANRKEVVGVDTRYKRYEEDIVALNMNTIAGAVYAPLRKAYDFLTHDILAEIPLAGSKLFPFRSPLEQYRKTYVEGAEYASWDRPYEDIVRPAIYDMALSNPLMAAAKGFGVGYLASGPMRWFTPAKILTNNSATPYIGAAVGAGLSTARILSLNSEDMIPYHVQREQEAMQYMDSINYIKGRLVGGAGGPGGSSMRTMMGATNAIQYRSALPRSADKRYFDYFASQTDESLRSQIMHSVPEHMQRGLSMAWDNDFYNNQESDALALNFIKSQKIPDDSWIGWSPEVSAAATRLRFVEHGLNGISDNIHRFGFYESHEVDMKTRLRDFRNQEINFVQSPTYGSFDSFLQDKIAGVSGGRVRMRRYSTPYGARRDIDYITE